MLQCHGAVSTNNVPKKYIKRVCVLSMGCGRLASVSLWYVAIEVEAGLGTHGHLPRT